MRLAAYRPLHGQPPRRTLPRWPFYYLDRAYEPPRRGTFILGALNEIPGRKSVSFIGESIEVLEKWGIAMPCAPSEIT